jgi:hypothetical protein
MVQSAYPSCCRAGKKQAYEVMRNPNTKYKLFDKILYLGKKTITLKHLQIKLPYNFYCDSSHGNKQACYAKFCATGNWREIIKKC